MGQAMGKMFSPDSMNVNGTGQTVGDLKGAGWTDQDFKNTGMDKQIQPNGAQKAGRGILGGFSQGMSAYDQQQARLRNGGGGSQISVPQTPQFDFSNVARSATPIASDSEGIANTRYGTTLDPYGMMKRRNSMLLGG